MKNPWAAIIIVLILVVGILYYTGRLDDITVWLPTGSAADEQRTLEDTLPQGTQPLYLSKNDIFQVFQGLSPKDLNYQEILPYIDALHMEMWGVSGTDALTVIDSYSIKYLSLGYVTVGRNWLAGPNWACYMEGWHLNQNAVGVLAGEGALAMEVYGHDVIILTSYGPLTTYYQFMALL